MLANYGVPHILQMRTKEVDSFARKIGRPDKNYERFEQITDLSGIRILTYLLGDAERVRGMIESEFKVDWQNTEDKRGKLLQNQLGYNSINYVVSLSDPRAGLTEYRDYATLKAEIQVDTLLSHVWSEIEHPYYKGEATVQPDLRRRLFLVRALLEVADLELQEFKEKESQTKSQITIDLRKKAPVEISVSALAKYLGDSEQVQELVTVASEVGFAIISSHQEQAGVVSDLADACLAVGIRSIDQLEEFLTASHDRTQKFLGSLNDHVRKTQSAPWSVGGAYLVLFLLISAFPDRLNEHFFDERRWSLKTVRVIREVPLG